MLYARVDWLVRKWLASTIHLRAAEETKLFVNSFISDHLSVYWQKWTTISWFLYSITKTNIHLKAIESGKYPSLFTPTSVNNFDYLPLNDKLWVSSPKEVHWLKFLYKFRSKLSNWNQKYVVILILNDYSRFIKMLSKGKAKQKSKKIICYPSGGGL